MAGRAGVSARDSGSWLPELCGQPLQGILFPEQPLALREVAPVVGRHHRLHRIKLLSELFHVCTQLSDFLEPVVDSAISIRAGGIHCAERSAFNCEAHELADQTFARCLIEALAEI